MKNAMHELQINNRDARIIAQSDELHRLRATNAELLALVRQAYDDSDSEILGEDWNEQARAAIAKAEGQS